MQKISSLTVDALKANGHYFAAGALAKQLGRGAGYGCHFGLRSELDHARAEYARGYNAA